MVVFCGVLCLVCATIAQHLTPPPPQKTKKQHHKALPQRVAGVMSAAEWGAAQARAKASPNFVLPIAKPGGGFLTLVLQWQMPFVLFTTLDEYRRSGAAAPPHFTVTHYDELARSHGVVLLRGDVINERLVSTAEVVRGG